MILHFDIIPHKHQRYDTVGDYVTRHGVTTFYISRMRDKRYVWLVFLHEVIEWGICRLTGVKQKDIDKYDIAYERERNNNMVDGNDRGGIRAPCGCKFQDEPGDDIHAPYFKSHQIATECERLIAKALDVDWMAYSEAIMRL